MKKKFISLIFAIAFASIFTACSTSATKPELCCIKITEDSSYKTDYEVGDTLDIQQELQSRLTIKIIHLNTSIIGQH